MVVASQQIIGDTEIVVAGVSLSNDSYQTAFNTTAQLIAAMPQNLRVLNLNSDVSVGEIAAPWTSNRPYYHRTWSSGAYWVDKPPMITAQ